jgi:signal transduction histidine kinase
LSEKLEPIGETGDFGNPLPGMNLRPGERLSSLVGCALCDIQLREELAILRSSEGDKAEYTRMLVHELRAPVTASRALAAALRHVHPEGTQVHEVLGRIEKRMDQLLDLVNDILHLNSIKAGQPLGETLDCDLVTETQSVCKPYLEEASAKGLSIEIELPASPLTMRIARQDYQLILSNIVSNAVKYTPAGSVEISLRQEGTWAILEVRDTGMGIPVREMAQIFIEFFRASNARHSQIPGTGLGLAGVKALVERCGGELALQSRENEGSRFTVRLPRRRQRPALSLVPSGTERQGHVQAALGSDSLAA